MLNKKNGITVLFIFYKKTLFHVKQYCIFVCVFIFVCFVLFYFIFFCDILISYIQKRMMIWLKRLR